MRGPFGDGSLCASQPSMLRKTWTRRTAVWAAKPQKTATTGLVLLKWGDGCNFDPSLPLHSRNVVLGISGGIAAYKAAELTRLLRKAGASVRVIMTHAAQRFVTPCFCRHCRKRGGDRAFDRTQESEISHINLADSADLLVIAPATADVIAKLSLGLASDLLSTVALACQAPLVICPAMNVNMWNKPRSSNTSRSCGRLAHTSLGRQPASWLVVGWAKAE